MIDDYQQAAFQKLLSVAKACFALQRHTLPIRPRTNTLIIGPSGTGKSHLARTVATELSAMELEVEFHSVSVGEWVLLGCSGRGGTPSWPVIVRFLKRNHNKSGVVLCADEIDKVSGGTTSETFLRTEIFSLLDLRIPTEVPEPPRGGHARATTVNSPRHKTPCPTGRSSWLPGHSSTSGETVHVPRSGSVRRKQPHRRRT